jgi:YD repeat-containing protein
MTRFRLTQPTAPRNPGGNHSRWRWIGHAGTKEETMADSRKWSQEVTEHSNALDLRPHVFELDDPKAVADSLKRSAEESTRRKADPFRSAMSMLTFYINRAGKNLPAKRKKVLEAAKDELRKDFGRPPARH